MSYLKQLSRKGEKEARVQPVSTRLTESEYKAFLELCNETGYSLSEALRLLVQQEISSPEDGMNTESKQYKSISKQSSADVLKTSSSVVKPSAIVNNPVKRVSKPIDPNNSNRFTTNAWKVNDQLPCPICEEWLSFKNFSRHVKTHHELTTQEIYELHKEKADTMVADMRSLLHRETE